MRVPSLIIPETVTTIKEGAFFFTGLKTVTYLGLKDPGLKESDFDTGFGYPVVCVPIDYADSSFMSSEVYPEHHPDLHSNGCYLALVCSNDTGLLMKRQNATE